MKKRVFIYVFISSLLLISVSSCDKDEVNYEGMDQEVAIVGEWMEIDSEPFMHIGEYFEGYALRFTADKQFRVVSEMPNAYPYDNYYYRLDSGTLYIDYHGQDSISNEYIFNYSFVKDKLMLEFITGSMAWTKYKPRIHTLKKVSD